MLEKYWIFKLYYSLLLQNISKSQKRLLCDLQMLSYLRVIILRYYQKNIK